MNTGRSFETWLSTLFTGTQVGEDEFGNRYYQARRIPKEGRRKRWVVYKGAPEPTKVPAYWHGWLHYTTDRIPQNAAAAHKFPWQKTHVPNLTGTQDAYVPPGHMLRGGQRAATVSDYEPWVPK